MKAYEGNGIELTVSHMGLFAHVVEECEECHEHDRYCTRYEYNLYRDDTGAYILDERHEGYGKGCFSTEWFPTTLTPIEARRWLLSHIK